MSATSRTILPVLLAIAVGACSTEIPITEVKGSCADVYNAQVCTWAKTQGDNLLEVGAAVPIASMENSPADPPMVWPPAAVAVLDIPEAARQKSGLTHFTMYWEAGGHPPGAFLTPHFDFHFYTIGSAERSAIDCVDLSKPAELPAGYALPDVQLPPHMAEMTGVPVLTGLCVPQLGMHAIPGLVGSHPTKFHAEYDATKQEYRMVLSGFASSS
jgi:hypothetical protein